MLDSKDSNVTPLHCAAVEGHKGVIKFLIEEQMCDPSISTSNGMTALHYATCAGHLDIVKYLIEEKIAMHHLAMTVT